MTSRTRKPQRQRTALAAAVALALGLSLPVAGADSPSATAQVPLLDPWVPPAARPTTVAPPASDAALRAKVERKLKRNFDDADAAGSGTLTRDQARAGGLGFVVRHFDAIDRQKIGVVRFDDVKAFLRGRGARID